MEIIVEETAKVNLEVKYFTDDENLIKEIQKLKKEIEKEEKESIRNILLKDLADLLKECKKVSEEPIDDNYDYELYYVQE